MSNNIPSVNKRLIHIDPVFAKYKNRGFPNVPFNPITIMLNFPEGRSRRIRAVSILSEGESFIKVKSDIFAESARFDIHQSFKVINETLGPFDIMEIEDSRGCRYVVPANRFNLFEELEFCPWDTECLVAV